MTVRRLEKSDADDIRRTHRVIIKIPANVHLERMIKEEVRKKDDASVGGEFKEEIVGYMISNVTSGNFGTDRSSWIARFAADPKFTGRGIGKNMAVEIFKVCKEKGIRTMYTSVKWDSTDLLSFFKTLGCDRSGFFDLSKGLKSLVSKID